MNRHRFRFALLLSGLGLLSGASALAEEQAFYFGLNGGISMFDVPPKQDLDNFFINSLSSDLANLTVPASISFAETSLDDSDEAWGATVGYRWNSYVAAEISYVNLGEALYEADLQINQGGGGTPLLRRATGTFESNGVTLAVLGMLPLANRFDLHVIGGIYFEDTRFNQPAAFEDAMTQQLILGHRQGRSNDKEFFAGVGAAWNINPSYSLRVQYQRYLDVGSDATILEEDVDLITASILFR